MTIANIDDKHMNNLLERFYDNVNENDISQCCLLYTSDAADEP